MRTIQLDHLIYAPIPYRGYGIRAWSAGANREEFRLAVRDWFVPMEQRLFRGGYEARMVVRCPMGRVFLARIFAGSRLDELKREGVVCHIAAIPDECLERGLRFRAVEQAMLAFHEAMGEIPQGEVGALQLSWEDSEEDEELQGMKALVAREEARRILEGFDKKYPKVLVLLKKNPWERIKLLYGLSKLLFIHGLRSFMALSDRPMVHILGLFDYLLIISDAMMRIRSQEEWTVVNLSRQEVRGEGGKAEDTLSKLYGNP